LGGGGKKKNFKRPRKMGIGVLRQFFMRRAKNSEGRDQTRYSQGYARDPNIPKTKPKNF